MPATWGIAFHSAVRSIQIHLLMSQRRKISYVKLQREVVTFSVVSSSTVAISVPTSVIQRLGINLLFAMNLASAFTVTAAIFAPGTYICKH